MPLLRRVQHWSLNIILNTVGFELIMLSWYHTRHLALHYSRHSGPPGTIFWEPFRHISHPLGTNIIHNIQGIVCSEHISHPLGTNMQPPPLIRTLVNLHTFSKLSIFLKTSSSWDSPSTLDVGLKNRRMKCLGHCVYIKELNSQWDKTLGPCFRIK